VKKMTQKPLRGKAREIVVNSLKEMAREANLSNQDMNRFVSFAIAWYNENGKRLWADPSYGLEWAYRFKNKGEYTRSDYSKLALLVKIDGKTDAISRLAKQKSSPSKYKHVIPSKYKHVIGEARETIEEAIQRYG
jgi:hypothetical protein